MTDRANADAVYEYVRTELVRFVRALRRDGASVPANASTTAARSLAEVGLDDRARVRAALRASLITDSDDFETFDRLFETFWDRLSAGLDAERPSLDDGETSDLHPSIGDPAAGEESADRADDRDAIESEIGRSIVGSSTAAGSDTDDGGDETTAALYSPSGSASTVDARLSADVDDRASAFRDLTRALAGLRGRRFQSGSDHTDVRRALRTSVSTGGTVLSVPKREYRQTEVRAVLLVDVSRSVLDTVDRGFLIDVLRRACREWRDVRVFFFDEGLREVTEAIDAPSATAAMEALEIAETEWGGGTRIGESFAHLRETAPESVDRRTVVFVVSDGLDMGDVSALERELSWISRRAKRVLWLNPLAAAETYEPTARGMAAARPYLDGLFAFAGPDDLVELARQLRQQGPGGRIGHEFDSRTVTKFGSRNVTNRQMSAARDQS